VQIPLQDLLLAARRRKASHAPGPEQAAWRAWAASWSKVEGYEATTRLAVLARGFGRHARLIPFAGRWAKGRTAPVPAPARFRDRWRERHP
jgi:hypothetical protein